MGRRELSDGGRDLTRGLRGFGRSGGRRLSADVAVNRTRFGKLFRTVPSGGGRGSAPGVPSGFAYAVRVTVPACLATEADPRPLTGRPGSRSERPRGAPRGRAGPPSRCCVPGLGATRRRPGPLRSPGGGLVWCCRSGTILPVQLDPSSLPEGLRDAVQREVAPLRLLEQVVRWAFSQVPPSDVADVIVQDEFSHDVVVPWRGVHLVFDTT